MDVYQEQEMEVLSPVRVLAFTSGKGGVGTTAIVTNLACALSRLDKKVLLIDADLHLSNINVFLGITPKYSLSHLLRGERTLEEVMVEGPEGIKVLSAGLGGQKESGLDEKQKVQLLDEFNVLKGHFDFVLLDTGTGISSDVIYFNIVSQQIVVVVSPEQASLEAASLLMGVLSTKYGEERFHILVNAVEDEPQGVETFQKLISSMEPYDQVSLDYLGFVMGDPHIPQAIMQQRPLLEVFPNSLASDCVMAVANRILHSAPLSILKGNIQFCMENTLATLR